MAKQRSQMAQRSPTGPLIIDVARLGRRPGSMFAVNDTVQSPLRIGVELIAIQPGAPLALDLRVESVSEGVLVTGTMSAPTAGECSRCLIPLKGQVEVDLTELFAYPDSITEATTEDDEVGHVVDQMVDLEQLIIDAVGLELPFSPVCSEDCPGLCPQCGVSLAAEPDHQHDLIDPRWAKLAEMAASRPDDPDPESQGHR